jgi:hypothetical protein
MHQARLSAQLEIRSQQELAGRDGPRTPTCRHSPSITYMLSLRKRLHQTSAMRRWETMLLCGLLRSSPAERQTSYSPHALRSSLTRQSSSQQFLVLAEYHMLSAVSTSSTTCRGSTRKPRLPSQCEHPKSWRYASRCKTFPLPRTPICNGKVVRPGATHPRSKPPAVRLFEEPGRTRYERGGLFTTNTPVTLPTPILFSLVDCRICVYCVLYLPWLMYQNMHICRSNDQITTHCS